MYTPFNKKTVQKNSAIQNKQAKSSASRQQLSFEDNRASTVQQQRLIAGIRQSSDTTQAKAKSQTAGSNAVIQRYTIVDPQDYQTQDDGQKPLFPSNQLESGRETTTQGGLKSVVSKRNWKLRTKDNPPLKVSEKGLLALESTVGQPKVFYGEAGNIQNFRQRLINIRSRITLDQEPGAKVTTPKNPANPDGQTQDLIRVKPVKSPHVNPNEELMDVSVCTFVSEKIVGGKHLVTGNKPGSEKVLGSVKLSDGNKFGRVLNQLDENNTTEGFEDKWQNDVSPYTFNNGPISEEVDNYFKTGFLGIRVRPSDRILRALSADGVPKALWKQVYEIYNQKSAENNNSIEDDVFPHITGYLKTQDTIRYKKTKGNQELTRDLGINEHTAPEVGESYSSFALPSPGTIDQKGITGDGVDVTTLDHSETQKLIKRFLALQTSSEKLGLLAKSQYQKAKGFVQFGDHHAAVVAKDGPDTVTFENYNRGVESDVFLDDVWEGWFTGSEEFRKDVNSEVRDMLRSIREEEQNPNYDNYLRKLRSFKKKKEALDKFQQDFVQITAKVRAKLETNIFDEQNDLWHFNMYGPANKTFTDENGNVSGQSFHDVWSKSVPNTVTVRTTGLVDHHMIQSVREKLPALAFQLIKGSNFEDPLYIYTDFISYVEKYLDPSTRRIDLSDVMVKLQKIEDNYPDLDSSETKEAAFLFTRNKSEILKKIMEFRHASQMQSQQHDYNRKKALELLPTNYEIGLKYARWSQENRSESKLLSNKAAFFLDFYKNG
ncbi:hypothetical protein [uncultured Fluviicola sp.]|uniref:hypothetical protein n=1 Tax=uncultured Fluviicola sp. TaxID=463303 RepID=UPI0025D88C58|nr:hypothetical protein [uncultured Fluviicola sp.]